MSLHKHVQLVNTEVDGSDLQSYTHRVEGLSFHLAKTKKIKARPGTSNGGTILLSSNEQNSAIY